MWQKYIFLFPRAHFLGATHAPTEPVHEFFSKPPYELVGNEFWHLRWPKLRTPHNYSTTYHSDTRSANNSYHKTRNMKVSGLLVHSWLSRKGFWCRLALTSLGTEQQLFSHFYPKTHDSWPRYLIIGSDHVHSSNLNWLSFENISRECD